MQPHGPFDSAYLSGLRPSSHVLSKQRGARLSPRQSCSPFCLCPGASPNACVSVRCGLTQRLWNPLGMPWEHSDPHKSAAVICDGCGFVTKQKYWGPKLAKAGSVHWHEGLHGKPYCPMCCVELALWRGADQLQLPYKNDKNWIPQDLIGSEEARQKAAVLKHLHWQPPDLQHRGIESTHLPQPMLLALDSVPGSDVSDRHRYEHGTPPSNDEIRRRVLELETEVAKLKKLVQQLRDNALQERTTTPSIATGDAASVAREEAAARVDAASTSWSREEVQYHGG